MDTAQVLFERGQKALADGNVEEAFGLFNAILNRKFDVPEVMYMVADCCIRKGLNGIAINLLGTCLQIKPDFQPGWNNLGVAFRHENFNKFAKAAWEKAYALEQSVEVMSNFATLSADSGDPDDAIRWCDEAIKTKADHWQSWWNKALAVLTKRNWAEGWDLYEHRLRLGHFDSRPTIDAPQWDGSYVEHLYVHGEQGCGDEVMFSSMLPDLLPRVGKVTVEAHKKFAGLLRRSFPGIAVVTEESEATGPYDAKCGMGSLAKYLRRSESDFPGTPYLKPDPALVEHYRQELLKIGPAPHVAIAWVGGTKKTRVEDRSVALPLFRSLQKRYTCVSAQYVISASEEIEAERTAANLPKIDDACSGNDLHAQAALFAACDAVVTVCQTAVHVAGAVGTPTFVLVPAKPSWRYGIEGDGLPWYNSVRLFRQGKHDTWLQVIARIEQAMRSHFRRREAA